VTFPFICGAPPISFFFVSRVDIKSRTSPAKNGPILLVLLVHGVTSYLVTGLNDQEAIDWMPGVTFEGSPNLAFVGDGLSRLSGLVKSSQSSLSLVKPYLVFLLVNFLISIIVIRQKDRTGNPYSSGDNSKPSNGNH